MEHEKAQPIEHDLKDESDAFSKFLVIWAN